MEHKIFVTLRNGEKKVFNVIAETRQDAKFIVFNRIFKYMNVAPKYIGAMVNKFNPQTYLKKVGA